MILSNVAIVRSLKRKQFEIRGLAGLDPTSPPFNTSAVDLRLSPTIRRYSQSVKHLAFDVRATGIAESLQRLTEKVEIDDDQPFALQPHMLVIAQTHEEVSFPLKPSGKKCYSARVEGKSSLARCGLIVHCTAPTIHANFEGRITLEIINLGPLNFLLWPMMYICQLIIEEVSGNPCNAPNQFTRQTDPAGSRHS
jgi:dCTP deaminase